MVENIPLSKQTHIHTVWKNETETATQKKSTIYRVFHFGKYYNY